MKNNDNKSYNLNGRSFQTKPDIKNSEESVKKAKILCLFYYFNVFLISGLSVWFLPIENIFLKTLVADILGTLFIYTVSVIHNNASFYDPYWSVYPVFIAFYWLWEFYKQYNNISIKQIVVVALVLFYAIRLTYNWASHWGGFDHEDWRYKKFREENPNLFWVINLMGIHLMPTLMVYSGSLSLFPALKPNTNFNILDILATIVTLFAILIEMFADIQMHRFAKTKKKGAIIETGLWKYSRHPNYLGEITFWWGLFLFGFSSDPSYAWTIIGPIAITLLFLFISIPMMEERSLKRRPTFKEYQKRVSKLLLWFPKKVNDRRTSKK